MMQDMILPIADVQFVLYFKADEDVMTERLLSRAKTRYLVDVSQRSDDNMESIKQRFEVFRNETLPVFKLFEAHNVPVICVDASGSVELVEKEVIAAVDALMK